MRLEKDNICSVEDHGFEDIEKLINMIGGKWKIQIIYHLSGDLNIQYGQLKRKIPKVSHKVLDFQLKDLEKDGLIKRIEYREEILKVKYSLTEIGISLLPIYDAFGKWCEKNRAIFK